MTDPAILGALLRREFELFLRFAYRELGGQGEYQHNWHIDAMIHELSRVRSGESRRLIMTMPPRHLNRWWSRSPGLPGCWATTRRSGLSA